MFTMHTMRQIVQRCIGSDNPRSRAVLRHGVALTCYIVLTLIWLRSLVLHLGDRVTSPGDPLVTAWRLVWPAQWLLHRPAPLWDSTVLYPAREAFARDELTLGQSLFAGPIHLLTGNPILAHNGTIILTMILSGFTMYYLAWYLFHTFTGSLVAGVIYAFAPYHLAQLDHAGLFAIQWLPLVLLFLHRTLRYRRWIDATYFGLAVFLQAIAAGYYAYWTALVILLFAGYVLLADHRLCSRAGFLRAGVALVVALLAVVPIALPFARIAAQERFARSREEVEYWSARPQSWLAATPGNLLYGPLVRGHAWTWSKELYLFPGLVALALAALAVLAWRGRLRWFALALTVTGFVLSLGPTLHLARRGHGLIPLPYDLIYRFVPGGDALRAPLRIAPVAMLGLGLLAAAGWEHITLILLLRNVSRWGTRVVAFTICGLLVAEYAIQPPATQAVPQLDPSPGTIAAWLAQEPSHIVAVFPDLRAPIAMSLATTTNDRFINGDAEMLPLATAALFDRLRAFPSTESVHALAALDVDTVVLLRAGYPDGKWGNLNERLRLPESPLHLRAMLTNGAIYALDDAQQPYATLQASVPETATVFVHGVSATDPTFLDRALATQALHGRHLCGTLRTGWTSEPDAPEPGEHFDFGLFQLDDAIPADFERAPIWTDGTMGLFRAHA